MKRMELGLPTNTVSFYLSQLRFEEGECSANPATETIHFLFIFQSIATYNPDRTYWLKNIKREMKIAWNHHKQIKQIRLSNIIHNNIIGFCFFILNALKSC